MVLLWGILMSINLYAGGRFALIEYKHSRRISNNEITIELGSENNNDKIFFARLNTKDIDQTAYSPITERVFRIEKEYFELFYNRLLDLDFKEIIKCNENTVGGDGYTVNITFGLRQNNIKLTLWSPDYNSVERKTDVFFSLLYELFSLFDMQEWL